MSTNPTATLAADLRAGADSPAELAAVELLAGAGWLAVPGLPYTTDRRHIRWDLMRVSDFTGWVRDVSGDVVFDLTHEQARVHDLAVSLASGEEVDMREVLTAVAGNELLAGLVLGALRIALSPMPTGGAR